MKDGNHTNSLNKQGWRQFLTARKEMLAAYDAAKEKDSIHKVQTYRGNVAEAQFRNWLSSFLPKKFGVTSGFIISQGLDESVQAPHFDVIIYNQLEAPILWVDSNPDFSKEGTSRAIPAEYVNAVLEVKSSLTYSSCKEVAKHLKELAPLLVKKNLPDERYKKYLPNSFFMATIFFELTSKNAKRPTLLDPLITDLPYQEFIGGLVLRGEGWENSESSGRITWVSTKQDHKFSNHNFLSPFSFSKISYLGNENQYLMLSWLDAYFQTFTFDLLALLNGTFEVGRLSSFNAFGSKRIRKVG